MSIAKRLACVFFLLGIGWSLPSWADWLPITNTPQTRTSYGSAKLTNGKVLVVGGFNPYFALGHSFLSSADLYDPATNSWVSAGYMSLGARRGATVTALQNGMALVTGGDRNFVTVGTADLYDSTTNSWSSAGNTATPRQSPVTLLPDGKVLVTGGTTIPSTIDGPVEYLASAEIYNPATNSWSSAGSMNAARAGHRISVLRNGKVLVTGGRITADFYGENGQLKSAELYDPATNSWSSAGNMTNSGDYANIALPNGKVLLMSNGANAELYDPESNSWTNAGSMAVLRYYHTVTLLPNGKVLVAGGADLDGKELSSAELYNPTTNSWSSAGNMAVVRRQAIATPLYNGKVLIQGGYCCFRQLGVELGNTTITNYASAELYDPVTNSWSSAGNMSEKRQWDRATLLPSGKVLVTADLPGSAELFDPGSPVAVEFYNSNLDHYFLTANADEATAIDKGSAGPGWSRTGNTFKTGGATSVCRFYGSTTPGPNSHFYTADTAECNSLKQQQSSTPVTQKRWNFEGMDFSETAYVNGACPAGTTPVYRAYNNGFARGVDSNHRYAASLTAIEQVAARGWIKEGIVMCAPL